MLRSLALAFLATVVLVPAAWAGTTYYATPLTANTTTCDQANPCTLAGAVGKTTDGDTVQLAPGDYHFGGASGSPLAIPNAITLEGQPGAERPRLLQEEPYTGCACPIISAIPHTTFRHLFFDQSVDASAPGGLQVQPGDVVEDVLALGGNQGGYSAGSTGEVTIRNSVLAGVKGGFDAETSVHFEHVTMRATGASGVGLLVQKSVAGSIAVTIDNSIAQGGSSGHDITANTFNPGASILVVGHYSALARSTGDSGGPGTEQIDLSDHDLSSDPIFNLGGFGVTGSSPTVDAGSAALTTVPLDFAGLPRALGPAPDMGAFEYAPAPGVQASAGDVGTTSAALSGSVDSAIAAGAHFEYGLDASYGSIAGSVDLPGAASPAAVGAALQGLAPNTTYHYRLVATNEHGSSATPDATFTTAAEQQQQPPPVVDSTAPRISKLRLRWPRITFALDEPATVRFTVGKRHWTRKLKAGKVTVKAPVKVRRAVKRGRHTLRVVAVDAAGNRAVALRKRFRT